MAWHADTAHGPPQHPDRHLAVPEQGGENSGPRRRRGGRHGGSSLRIPSCCRITTKWIRDFKRAASTRHFDAGSASQAAGRVSLAVTVAHNKVGRAYARPLHRQAHAPLGGGLFSPWLLQCLHGWIAFPDQVADVEAHFADHANMLELGQMLLPTIVDFPPCCTPEASGVTRSWQHRCG